MTTTDITATPAHAKAMDDLERAAALVADLLTAAELAELNAAVTKAAAAYTRATR